MKINVVEMHCFKLQFIFDLHSIKLQYSVRMLSWESIHWRVVIHDVLFRTNTVFSKAEIVERIVDFIKPKI